MHRVCLKKLWKINIEAPTQKGKMLKLPVLKPKVLPKLKLPKLKKV